MFLDMSIYASITSFTLQEPSGVPGLCPFTLSSPSFSFNFGWSSNQPPPDLSPRHRVRQRRVCGGWAPLPAVVIESAGVIEWQMNSGFLTEIEGK